MKWSTHFLWSGNKVHLDFLLSGVAYKETKKSLSLITPLCICAPTGGSENRLFWLPGLKPLRTTSLDNARLWLKIIHSGFISLFLENGEVRWGFLFFSDWNLLWMLCWPQKCQGTGGKGGRPWPEDYANIMHAEE